MRLPRRWIGIDGERVHRRGDQRQQPVQIEHRADQADDGDDVGDAVDRAGQRLADDRGVGGEAGGELGRGLALHAGEVGVREVGEHAALQLADHQQHDLLDRTFWTYCAAALTEVTATHQGGTW